VDLLGAPTIIGGVVERSFQVTGGREVVPGILWTPAGATGPRPLVLVGHPLGGDKRTSHALALVDRVVDQAGWAVAAIDAIGHGDRALRSGVGGGDGGGGGVRAVTPAHLGAAGDACEEMAEDWTATLTALRSLDDIGDGPVGYFGLSMGTVFGLAFLATAPAVRCAALGLMGTFGAVTPWARAAPSVTCPVTFFVQRRDTLIRAAHAKALYRSLGSTDKRLRANRGGHSELPDKAFDTTTRFLCTHLR